MSEASAKRQRCEAIGEAVLRRTRYVFHYFRGKKYAKPSVFLRQSQFSFWTLDSRSAFGKLILFGEHFVVYKVPALVGAVAAYTDCDCEFSDAPGLEVVDDRPAVPGYKVEKKEEADEAIGIVLKHFDIDPKKRGVKLTFGGDLTAVSGIGASAAQVVAMARAIGLSMPLALSEDEINAAGYEGEKGYHGTPSGVDNTAATYGGVLRFQRTDGAPRFAAKELAGLVPHS